jgi:hypothetical protein
MKSIVHLVPLWGISAWERGVYKVVYVMRRMGGGLGDPFERSWIREVETFFMKNNNIG